MARIAGVNIPQNKVVHIALTYIHGIGDKISKDICSKLNISKDKRANSLTEDEVLKIREEPLNGLHASTVMEWNVRLVNECTKKCQRNS